MTKQTIVKDDGRLLIYYWFDRARGDGRARRTDARESSRITCQVPRLRKE